MSNNKIEALPFDIAAHLDTLEAVKGFLQEFINDGTFDEMKSAIDIAARAKVFRDGTVIYPNGRW